MSRFGAFAAFLISAVLCTAEVLNFTFPITGAQQVPPVVTPGIGVGHIVLNTNSRVMNWTIRFQNLAGEPQDAHFHGPATYGQNAPIQIDLMMHISPLVGQATLSTTFLSQVLAGNWYFNLHTSIHGSGEIRGQVVPACLTCDLNCDGSVNPFDIQPFLNVLTNGAPPCSGCAGDTDFNGSVNPFDIQPFVECLTA